MNRIFPFSISVKPGPLLTGIGKVLTGMTLLTMAVLPQDTYSAGYLSNLSLKAQLENAQNADKEQITLSGSYLAAEIAGKNNDEEQAVINYQRVLDFDGQNSAVKQSLFSFHVANGQIDKAIALLKTIAPEEQKSAISHVVTALDAFKHKSWQQAVQRIEKVSGTDLDTLMAMLVKSWAYFGAAQIDRALETVEAIGGPDWSKMIRDYHKGLILSASGRDKEAIAAFEAATANKALAAALSETYLRAVEALVRAKMRSGDKAGALKVLANGRAEASSHEPLKLLEKAIKQEEAIAPLITSANGGGAEIFYNIGSAINRQDGRHFAQSHLQLAHYLRPDSDLILYGLADIFDNQKKYERANALYGKIDKASPYWRSAQLEIGVNLNELEKLDEAEVIFSGLMEEFPDDLLAALTYGGAYAEHEKYHKAAEIYSAMIDRFKGDKRNHWSIYYRRGIAYERTQQWDKAEKDFKKALSLSPNQALVLNYLGYSWIDMGKNLDEGLEMIRKAVKLRPREGFIIDSLGWAYYRLGRYEEARVELEKALDAMPYDPVINDHLGDAYWKTDRKLEATFMWRHALSYKPEKKDEVKILEKLEKGLQ